MNEIQSFEDQSFAALYNQYFDRAMRTAKGILGDDYLAADAVQETFIRVYRKSYQYDTSKPFEPWFNKILINECRRIGKARNQIIYMDHYKESDLTERGHEENFQQLNELERVLGSLGEKIKTPLILKYIQGLKTDEIAEIMNLNTNTVKSRLLFGRNKLKAIYTKLYKEVR